MVSIAAYGILRLTVFDVHYPSVILAININNDLMLTSKGTSMLKAHLSKQNIIFTWQRYTIDALNGMTLGYLAL